MASRCVRRLPRRQRCASWCKASLAWPLSGLFRHIEQRRARSRLEESVLSEAAPIGAWIAQGAGPRKQRHQQSQETEAEPLPLDLELLAERFAVDGDLARAVPG